MASLTHTAATIAFVLATAGIMFWKHQQCIVRKDHSYINIMQQTETTFYRTFTTPMVNIYVTPLMLYCFERSRAFS